MRNDYKNTLRASIPFGQDLGSFKDACIKKKGVFFETSRIVLSMEGLEYITSNKGFIVNFEMYVAIPGAFHLKNVSLQNASRLTVT